MGNAVGSYELDEHLKKFYPSGAGTKKSAHPTHFWSRGNISSTKWKKYLATQLTLMLILSGFANEQCYPALSSLSVKSELSEQKPLGNEDHQIPRKQAFSSLSSSYDQLLA